MASFVTQQKTHYLYHSPWDPCWTVSSPYLPSLSMTSPSALLHLHQTHWHFLLFWIYQRTFQDLGMCCSFSWTALFLNIYFSFYLFPQFLLSLTSNVALTVFNQHQLTLLRSALPLTTHYFLVLCPPLSFHLFTYALCVAWPDIRTIWNRIVLLFSVPFTTVRLVSLPLCFTFLSVGRT